MTQKQKGILLITASSFFFALMNLFVRLSGDLPAIQKSFFRNFVALIFAAILLFQERPKLTFTPKSKRHLFLRALFGTVGILCNFYAVDHLVLADASMLNKMSPFCAVIFGAFLLKEKPNRFQSISILVAFIGVLFIVQQVDNSPSQQLIVMPLQEKSLYMIISKFHFLHCWAFSYLGKFPTGSVGLVISSFAAQQLPCFYTPPKNKNPHNFRKEYPTCY